MESKVYSKTIRTFLIDGTPQGRLTCELSNWTGKLYKIPRNLLRKSLDRTELNCAGVYLLFGNDPENPEHDMVYIGETGNILERLTQHFREKDFWNEAIVIVSKDSYLNLAHVKYLESKMYHLTKKIQRYKLENTNEPRESIISESEIAEMEEFLDNVLILVGSLGYKVFEEIDDELIEIKSEQIFSIQGSRGAEGKGRPVSDGFLVLKDSKLASTTENCREWVIRVRERLESEEVIKEEAGQLVMKRNYIFSSPSTAAAVIVGRNANGRTTWKLPDGTTLKEFELRGI